MLLVAAVTSASLDLTNTMADAEWFPIESSINYRIDSRMCKQSPFYRCQRRYIRFLGCAHYQRYHPSEGFGFYSGICKLLSKNALLFLLLFFNLFDNDSITGRHQTVKFVPIALPLDTSAISLNSCIFIYLKTAIVVGIIDPHACSKFCARNSECTHFTNEPLKSGGTSTLHKAPGLGSDWSPPAPQRSGVTCGHMSP